MRTKSPAGEFLKCDSRSARAPIAVRVCPRLKWARAWKTHLVSNSWWNQAVLRAADSPETWWVAPSLIMWTRMGLRCSEQVSLEQALPASTRTSTQATTRTIRQQSSKVCFRQIQVVPISLTYRPILKCVQPRDRTWGRSEPGAEPHKVVVRNCNSKETMKCLHLVKGFLQIHAFASLILIRMIHRPED